MGQDIVERPLGGAGARLHQLIRSDEKHDSLSTLSELDDREEGDERPAPVSMRSASATHPVAMASDERVLALESNVRELQGDFASIRDEFRVLQDRFDDLRRQLGG